MSKGMRVREHRGTRKTDRSIAEEVEALLPAADQTIRTMNPSSSVKVADLADAFIDASWWRAAASSRDAIELIATIRRLAAAGPEIDSTRAKSMATAAKRIAELACEETREGRMRNPDGRDLSWFTDPVLMDEHERDDRSW
jgi:hypothetical protein